MKKLVLSAVLGGVAMFAWPMISWMALSNVHMSVMPNLPGGDSVTKAITKAVPESGLYLSPGMDCTDPTATKEANEAAMKAHMEKVKAGPNIFLLYNKEGMDPMAPGMYIRQLVLSMIVAFLAAWLLLQTKIASYGRRVAFVFIIGAVVVLAGVVPNWNWWGFPAKYIALESVDSLMSMLFGGLVIGYFANPKA